MSKKQDKKKSRVFIGDFIVTNDEFKPMVDGMKIDMKNARIKGIVVSKQGGLEYGIRLGPGFNFTNHLNGILKEPDGYVLSRNEFELLSEMDK